MPKLIKVMTKITTIPETFQTIDKCGVSDYVVYPKNWYS